MLALVPIAGWEVTDIYCERLGPELWAEPVNAATNLAFLFAAWATWRIAQKQSTLTPDIRLLIGLITAIGVGSGLYHTFATRWAELLDVLPILLFQLLFLGSYCSRIILIQPIFTGLIVLAYAGIVFWAGTFSHLLNGSLAYAPAILVLGIVGCYHCATDRNRPNLLLIAALVFLISLTFRTLDNAFCPYIPLDTHFLWHLLNALLLYLLMVGLIANIPGKGYVTGS